MKKEDITENLESLAYVITEAKEERKGLTVFLGAGMSVSAGVPSAKDIIKDILSNKRYTANPKIKELTDKQREDYAKVMSCLRPSQRKELFTKYISKSKVNVAHIYLAHMMKEGYVDYVLTPNFDDLMLRALSLFNIFPPVYDLAMLDSLDNTTLDKQTIVYLHGRHNGLWQLNTGEEMDKVNDNDICQRLFAKIQDRPWLVVGYSGSDKIFDHICKQGRFTNGLYWVCPSGVEPSERVCNNLLKQKNKGAYLIPDYDADTLMIKLHNLLKIKEHPPIFTKPFSQINELLSSIVDIENKIEFSSVKERLDISKRQVSDAIDVYEKNKVTSQLDTDKLTKDKLHKDILDLIANQEFDENKIKAIEDQVMRSNDKKSKELLSDLYFSVAYNVKGEDETALKKQIDYYTKSNDLLPDANTFYNLGNSLSSLAKLQKNKELYEAAIFNLKKAIELDSSDAGFYSNLGIAMNDLASLLQDEELHKESINSHKKAIELDSSDANYYSNLAVAIGCLARMTKNEDLYKESIANNKKAIELNSDNSAYYSNLGVTIGRLARMAKNEDLFKESITNHKKAIELDSSNVNYYSNLFYVLVEYAKFKNDNSYLFEAVEVMKKGEKLGADIYDLACAYALLKNKAEALSYLDKSLIRQEQTVEFILDDDDWTEYLDDADFKAIIAKYKDKYNGK